MNSTNKYCPNCNTSNLDSAKFCSNCGYKFNKSTKNNSDNVCSQCEEVNKQDAKFCAHCGNSFQNRNQINKEKINNQKRRKSAKLNSTKRKQNQKSILVPVLIIAGGLIIFYLFVMESNEGSRMQNNIPVENVSQNINISSQVFSVASKFTCPCGSCGDEALETCTCATAVREREYIKTELNSGKSVQQVIAAVNSKYGHLKPEYAGKFVNDLNLNLSQKLKINDLSSISNIQTEDIKFADFNDKEEIFAHFECPCGQCGIPELIECNCTHPGGATEVKLFIDEKIKEKNYTVAQIIEKVNEHYGHQIR